MLQIACKTHSFKTSVYSCLQTGGIESLKYIQTNAINWVLLNQNIDFFFDKSTFTLMKALPLLRGVGNDGWAWCQHNYAEAERTAANTQKPFYWDISIKNITLDGFVDTKKIQEARNVCEMIMVSRLHNGLTIVDGMSYNQELNILYPTELITARLSEVQDTSGTWDNTNQALTMTFFCRQRQKGFSGVFDFYEMNQYYDTQNGVFSTTDNSIFITTDNSAFSL